MSPNPFERYRAMTRPSISDTSQEMSNAAFQGIVLTKLERIESELAVRNSEGGAFEQVTRERLEGMKWTAGILGGAVALFVSLVSLLLGYLKKP